MSHTISEVVRAQQKLNRAKRGIAKLKGHTNAHFAIATRETPVGTVTIEVITHPSSKARAEKTIIEMFHFIEAQDTLRRLCGD